MDWYRNSYRRHLLDMHIDDWDDDFLSQFTAEEYVSNLIKGNVDNAMIYLQSHTGLCHYPTHTGKMHKAFIGKEDTIQKLAQLCHSNGISVTGYYSINYNTFEHDRNPSWREVNANGRSSREDDSLALIQRSAFASLQYRRYGLCCPNNVEYRQFVFAQIDEMLDYCDMDGIFFDMPYWPSTCYCKHCRKRFLEETGYAMPEKPFEGSEDFIALMNKKSQWMGEWTETIYNYVKAKKPQLSVEFNFAAGIAESSFSGCGKGVHESSDYIGGDLYGGIISHSFACKMFRNMTKNQPFEYMMSRCKPALRTHTLTKTKDTLRTEIFLNAAHHGATLFIDAIDPVGTMDERVYDTLGEIYRDVQRYEKYFVGNLVEDVAVYYGLKSRFSYHNEVYNNLNCSVKIIEHLIGDHIPFGVTGEFHALDGYRMIFAPMLSSEEGGDNARLIDYVQKGGVLYISGANNRALIEELLSGKVIGRTEEKSVYLVPTEAYKSIFLGFNEKYPLPFDGTAPLVQLECQNGVVAKLKKPYTTPNDLKFASIHSDPPGIMTEYPMIVVKNYGKGKVIWSAVPIEYNDFIEYRQILNSLIKQCVSCQARSFESNAPKDVEITLFHNDDSWTVNVNLVTDKEIAREVAPFQIRIKSQKVPKSIELLVKKEEVEFSYRDGYIEFATKTLNIFDMYEIKF